MAYTGNSAIEGLPVLERGPPPLPAWLGNIFGVGRAPTNGQSDSLAIVPREATASVGLPPPESPFWQRPDVAEKVLSAVANLEAENVAFAAQVREATEGHRNLTYESEIERLKTSTQRLEERVVAEHRKGKETEMRLTHDIELEWRKFREMEVRLKGEIDAEQKRGRVTEVLLQQKLDAERKKSRETETELKSQMEALRRDSQRVTEAVSSQLDNLRAGAAALEAKKILQLELDRTQEECRALKAALSSSASGDGSGGGGGGAVASLIQELDQCRLNLQAENARCREIEARARKDADAFKAQADAAAAAARREGVESAERQLLASVKGLQDALGAEQTRAREAEARLRRELDEWRSKAEIAARASGSAGASAAAAAAAAAKGGSNGGVSGISQFPEARFFGSGREAQQAEDGAVPQSPTRLGRGGQYGGGGTRGRGSREGPAGGEESGPSSSSAAAATALIAKTRSPRPSREAPASGEEDPLLPRRPQLATPAEAAVAAAPTFHAAAPVVAMALAVAAAPLPPQPAQPRPAPAPAPAATPPPAPTPAPPQPPTPTPPPPPATTAAPASAAAASAAAAAPPVVSGDSYYAFAARDAEELAAMEAPSIADDASSVGGGGARTGPQVDKAAALASKFSKKPRKQTR